MTAVRWQCWRGCQGHMYTLYRVQGVYVYTIQVCFKLCTALCCLKLCTAVCCKVNTKLNTK